MHRIECRSWQKSHGNSIEYTGRDTDQVRLGPALAWVEQQWLTVRGPLGSQQGSRVRVRAREETHFNSSAALTV